MPAEFVVVDGEALERGYARQSNEYLRVGQVVASEVEELKIERLKVVHIVQQV